MSRHAAIHYRRSKEQLPSQAIELQVGGVVNKKSLLNALGEACQFPEYYGKNWDAAWDCLHDVDVEHLVLDLQAIQQLDKAALKDFISLINDAYDAWQQPQLWIIQQAEKS